MKYPDQEIHDEIYKIVSQLGYRVFTFLPKEGTKYPFIVIGDTHLLPTATKSFLIGEVALNIHVWSDMTSRKKVSDIIHSLLHSFSKIRRIDERQWSMKLGSDSQIIKDNSTDEQLYHGIISVNFKFIG
ncbi:hypothetical protein HZY83_07375 [Gemella sp. GH3]|uniref:hypothetical protein n=1 Tax=unclassified Gemella TaxID=2624949 RepID=UPI0015CF8E78|nr:MULTISPECIES: hypothetical protein [unclassified Gemella]MBF0714494.1 hypothetical protein [Gemella sp. GH3.1]NYS51446.1 hypothetical protein [Gemella sp. GH3]